MKEQDRRTARQETFPIAGKAMGAIFFTDGNQNKKPYPDNSKTPAYTDVFFK